jgi:hypothetical protein
MNEPDWKDLVLQSLEQRDAYELASADIYDACTFLLYMQVLICRHEACHRLCDTASRGLPRNPPPNNPHVYKPHIPS